MHLMPVIGKIWRPKKPEPCWRSKQLCTIFWYTVLLKGGGRRGNPTEKRAQLKKIKKKTLTRRKGQGHTSILNSNNEDNKNSVGR